MMDLSTHRLDYSQRYILRRPVSVNLNAADVNLDFEVDSTDVTVLKRFYKENPYLPY